MPAIHQLRRVNGKTLVCTAHGLIATGDADYLERMKAFHTQDGHAAFVYCMMSGHSQVDCPGFPSEEHMELCRQGVGFSRVPGPSDKELREEISVDRDLMVDEYHGRDLDA